MMHLGCMQTCPYITLQPNPQFTEYHNKLLLFLPLDFIKALEGRELHTFIEPQAAPPQAQK